MIRQLTIRNLSAFSKTKKNNPIDNKQIKISKLKIKSQFKGYRIFQYDQTKSFKKASIFLGMMCSASPIILYLSPTIANFMCSGLAFLGYYSFIKRNSYTLKRAVIDQTGQNLYLTFHGAFGFKQLEQTITLPIYIMAGIIQRKFKRGIIIQAGGMFGYKKINIFFRPQGILDKKTFESVMNGKIVKYSDVL